jgi:hypothetical protein
MFCLLVYAAPRSVQTICRIIALRVVASGLGIRLQATIQLTLDVYHSVPPIQRTCRASPLCACAHSDRAKYPARMQVISRVARQLARQCAAKSLIFVHTDCLDKAAQLRQPRPLGGRRNGPPPPPLLRWLSIWDPCWPPTFEEFLERSILGCCKN